MIIMTIAAKIIIKIIIVVFIISYVIVINITKGQTLTILFNKILINKIVKVK